jgi:hypothetical protein
MVLTIACRCYSSFLFHHNTAKQPSFSRGQKKVLPCLNYLLLHAYWRLPVSELLTTYPPHQCRAYRRPLLHTLENWEK